LYSIEYNSDGSWSITGADIGRSVRAVSNKTTNMARKKAMKGSTMPKPISRKSAENIIVVAKEETEKTGQVKRTYMKLESK
jgi:hypothetical protein